MVPAALKDLFAPASYPFFLFMLGVGVLLLFRRKDGGRAGRIWMLLWVACYWLLSTPVVAVGMVKALTTDYALTSKADANGATAVVVLSAGMQVHRSRGELYEAASREGALRALEAVRVYRLIDPPWVVTTGGMGTERHTEADLMAEHLIALGVPPEKIVRERQSTNTHEQALLVPKLLAGKGVTQFVLVTSRPHMARSLRTFAAVGLAPVPSCPDVYAWSPEPIRNYLPSQTALFVSEQLLYDWWAIAYYRLRGWLG